MKNIWILNIINKETKSIKAKLHLFFVKRFYKDLIKWNYLLKKLRRKKMVDRTIKETMKWYAWAYKSKRQWDKSQRHYIKIMTCISVQEPKAVDKSQRHNVKIMICMSIQEPMTILFLLAIRHKEKSIHVY